MNEHLTRFQWERFVLKSDLRPVTRLVLLVLGTFINSKTGRAWPSGRVLADACGMSERALIPHLHRAEKLGWIVRQKHAGQGKRWATSAYSIAIPPDVSSGPKRGESHEETSGLIIRGGAEVGARAPDARALGHDVRADGPDVFGSMVMKCQPGNDLTALGISGPTRSTNIDKNKGWNKDAPQSGAEHRESSTPALEGQSKTAWQKHDDLLYSWAEEHGVLQRAGESDSAFRMRIVTVRGAANAKAAP